MIEYLWTFQYRINGLQPHLLLTMAFVAFAVGLFLWLGGIGFRRIMFALVGAACGAACAIPVTGSNLMLGAALVGAGALLALKFQENFLTVMASIFALVYGFSVLIRPYFNPNGELIAVVRQLTIGVPYYNWPILLFVIALPLAAGASYWRATSAILCSAAGAAVMLAGVIMLLVRSGIAAAGFISTKREFFLEIFLAVAVLGAISQLLLLPKLGCRFEAARKAVKTRAKRTKKDRKDDGISTSTFSAWRTS